MLNVAGLALFAAVSIYRGDDLAGSGALFLAGLVVLLMLLSQVLASSCRKMRITMEVK
jgi:hypothetical protein